MRISLDITNHTAPFVLAEQFQTLPKGEAVEIAIPHSDVCPSRIVPVVGLADEYRSRGHDVSFLVVPHSMSEQALKGFNNRSFSAQGKLLNTFNRVWCFENAQEQTNLVSALVLELGKTANLAKGVKQCFEWCLNEVTDNVLNHSQPRGETHGYVMVQYEKASNRLKICVFDAGIGLKESFIGSKYEAEAKKASDAIRLAIGKGITNGNGQGNGLWGLHEMVKISKCGKLHIRSDGAEYLFDPARGIDSTRDSWNIPGFPGTTTVDFQMDCSASATLQDIFGADYISVDLWQEAHELEDGSLHIKVSEIAEGYGSRESASKVRHLVENAIDNDRKFVVLDFAGVESCSSSFIDELLVKLVAKYKIATYSSFFRVIHLTGLTAGLANFSAAQRLSC